MKKETDPAPQSAKRNELIKYAYDLFYKNGFHATGVDTIIGGTGISKRTLYKYFTSKEGLIIAALEYYHQTRYKVIADYLERTTVKNPVDKALRIFDFLSEQIDAGNLDGCFAMNARTEYANKAQEIEAACDAYVASLQQLMEQYLKEGNVPDNRSVALQVIMLFEGSLLRSLSVRNSKPVALAKAAAKQICS